MQKDVLVHYSFALVYFFLITVFREYFSFYYLAFWLGGVLGTLLPDIDHLVYVYVLKPKEAHSEEVVGLIKDKKYKETWNYLVATRQQRVGLIFHSALFQLIFLVFTLYVATSSGSLFGKGLVLAFSLHLFIDQLVDYLDLKKIDNWFTDFPVKLDNRQKIWYLWGVGALLLYLGFFL